MIRCDVVVIGAGVMGAATARALAMRGRSVVLLEQFEIGHTRGSSHGSARVFRLSYPDPRYVQMGREALPLWHALEAETGARLLHPAPAINAGAGLGELVETFIGARVPHVAMSGAEAARRYAGITEAVGDRVVVEHGAAVLAAERAWRALIASGVNHGVALREHTRAQDIRQDADGVTVATNRGDVRARVAVVTAGPWVAEVARNAGIAVPVRTTRETVTYHDDGGVEVPILIDRRAPMTYALPVPGGGIKAGEHFAGHEASPDAVTTPDERSARQVAAWVGARFLNARAKPRAVETCFYTNTADEHFVFEQHARIVVGSPCSGHGFKFAPWIGARLAILAQAVS